MLWKLLKSTISVCLGLLLTAEAVGQEATAPQVPTQTQAAKHDVTLRRDTEVEVLLLESISSATATKGQAVRLAVAKDVVVKGRIVIPRGTPGTGVVSRLEKAVPGKRDGYLEVRPVDLTLADGTKIKMKEFPTGEDRCANAGPCWVLFALEAPLLPLAALMAFSDGDEVKHVGKDMTREICSWSGAEAYVAHRQTLQAVDLSVSKSNAGLPQCPSKENEPKSAAAP